MSEIALTLRSLEERHTQPLVNYRRGDVLTHVVLNALADHVLKVYTPQNLDAQRQRTVGTYKVLLLSQPHEPELERQVLGMRSVVNEPYRHWMPSVQTDAPVLTDLRRPSDKKWHAIVASTFLEHEKNPMDSLIGLHDRLQEGGCLLLVTHVPDGPVPAAMERDATNLREAFRTLQEFARNKVSRKDAIARLGEFEFKRYIGQRGLTDWLEEFKKDPAARRAVDQVMDKDSFGSPLIVARRIRAQAKTPLRWAALLEDAGFHVHFPLAAEVGKEGHPLLLLPAYKGSCPEHPD